ncbi:MAG: twin-arginine translocase TatA/TatE family subunit, partial [Streptomyces sp.]
DMARSLGKSARILKSEAKAMKKDGGDGGDGDKDQSGTEAQQSAPKTIQAAPGDVNSSRPVEEPSKQSNQN